MRYRYWVDLRKECVAVIDGNILHGICDELSPNLECVVKFWDGVWDEVGLHFYLPLEFETEANKLCIKLNKKDKENK